MIDVRECIYNLNEYGKEVKTRLAKELNLKNNIQENINYTGYSLKCNKSSSMLTLEISLTVKGYLYILRIYKSFAFVTNEEEDSFISNVTYDIKKIINNEVKETDRVELKYKEKFRW